MTISLFLQKSDGSGPATWPTEVLLSYDDQALFIEFRCRDDDAWATFQQRDEPLWQEEVVEVFLSPGEACPQSYSEFEVNPRGALFDARVDNPDGRRQTMRVDIGWNCPGIRWAASRLGSQQDWQAELTLPWHGLGIDGSPPTIWRANFFRVERPRYGVEEFTSWSPTLRSPPDFHVPNRFGYLSLSDSPLPADLRSSRSAPLPVVQVPKRCPTVFPDRASRQSSRQ